MSNVDWGLEPLRQETNAAVLGMHNLLENMAQSAVNTINRYNELNANRGLIADFNTWAAEYYERYGVHADKLIAKINEVVAYAEQVTEQNHRLDTSLRKTLENLRKTQDALQREQRRRELAEKTAANVKQELANVKQELAIAKNTLNDSLFRMNAYKNKMMNYASVVESRSAKQARQLEAAMAIIEADPKLKQQMEVIVDQPNPFEHAFELLTDLSRELAEGHQSILGTNMECRKAYARKGLPLQMSIEEFALETDTDWAQKIIAYAKQYAEDSIASELHGDLINNLRERIPEAEKALNEEVRLRNEESGLMVRELERAEAVINTRYQEDSGLQEALLDAMVAIQKWKKQDDETENSLYFDVATPLRTLPNGASTKWARKGESNACAMKRLADAGKHMCDAFHGREPLLECKLAERKEKILTVLARVSPKVASPADDVIKEIEINNLLDKPRL